MNGILNMGPAIDPFCFIYETIIVSAIEVALVVIRDIWTTYTDRMRLESTEP